MSAHTKKNNEGERHFCELSYSSQGSCEFYHKTSIVI